MNLYRLYLHVKLGDLEIKDQILSTGKTPKEAQARFLDLVDRSVGVKLKVDKEDIFLEKGTFKLTVLKVEKY